LVIKRLRDYGMDDRNQRHVRLLAQRDAQTKRAVRGQITHQQMSFGLQY